MDRLMRRHRLIVRQYEHDIHREARRILGCFASEMLNQHTPNEVFALEDALGDWRDLLNLRLPD